MDQLSDTELLQLLKTWWHYPAFRPQQEAIIRSVLQGSDTLALLPTGGGKSLCFQVPAMAKPGLCLVISPLIALMKDQTDSLRRKNITAFALHSGLNRGEVINILQQASRSNCKFLYVSPERLETALFNEYLPSLGISLIAVDEAHCVSQWGYDFRPPYLRIAAIRESLPNVPLLALTASATPSVMEDIVERLGMKGASIFRQSFTRPNLSYSFFSLDNKLSKMAEILERVPGSSIVYCKTRKATRDISEWLVRQGISAAAYHARLTQEERMTRQDDWLKDRVRVIVSTNAFGMGIDKPSVRTVIHADVPESVENYYQEAGRAGRDGEKAYAVLLASSTEAGKLEGLPEKRFPPIEQIRPVYQHLMNYLQLPEGTGEDQYFDFDLTRFANQFELDMQTVTTTLTVLEQENLLSYQTQVFLPGKVRFTTDKENLYEFEKERPVWQPLINALLRTYEGIFEQPVAIREKQLAYITRATAQQVILGLERLQTFGIIEYMPQKDSPQLYFLRNRPAAEVLYIDPIKYRERKEQYAMRIRAILRYLKLTEECRSRYLANYFGDKAAVNCGVCDNCLRRDRTAVADSGRRR